MNETISLSLSPIGPWVVIILAAIAIIAMTLWPYQHRIAGVADRRRWIVLGLRLFALALCIMAMLRPSVLVLEKIRQESSVILLSDASTSMKITDEVNNTSRWVASRRAIETAKTAVRSKLPDLSLKTYQFDGTIKPETSEDPGEPLGQETAIGAALMETLQREVGTRIASILVFSDGASNTGIAPQTAAQNLRSQGVPVVTIGFGSTAAGASSRDIAVTAMRTAETVFVKNTLDVSGTLRVRGYPGQTLDVELLVEGQSRPVARTQVRVPENSEVVSVRDLKYTPETAGEKLLTLRVPPKEGELIPTNNEYSSFVTVLSGGLNVLHVQGPGTIWEGKFVTRSLDQSQEIQSNLQILLQPARGDQGALADEDFTPGRYDVYIFGDVPADFLTPVQHRLLARAVEQGAGLMMLGGRDSFGDGGWGRTALAEILPTQMNRGDGQIEPEGGLQVIPNLTGLSSYILQIGPTQQDTALLWENLPRISGASRVGRPKANAVVWAETDTGDPLMVGADGVGRVIVFGGETWPWYRESETSQAAHRRFWRQAVLWLAHKEDSGESGIDLKLDRRRLATGESLGITAQARDEEGLLIPDAQYRTQVTRSGDSDSDNDHGDPEPVDLFNQADGAKGTYYAMGDPGEYTVTVVGTKDGQEIGRASSRFLVYQDDRELENPAANIALLQQIAELTDGEFLRPEQLESYFDQLDPDEFTRVETQVEYRLWDNWPFLLLFVATLSLEWFLRKRMGWV